MRAKYSVETFKQILSDETRKIALDGGLNWDNETHRGRSFQIWIAQTISNYEQTFDTAPDEALLTSKDLGVDLVFEDSMNNHLLICQCKYRISKKQIPVDENEVVSFLNRHNLFMDRSWVEKHGSQEAREMLMDYRDRVKAGYTIEYRFITTANASDRIKEIVEKKNDEYVSKDIPIKCELLDFSSLKEYYARAQSLEDTIPEEVHIVLSAENFIKKQEPYKTVIAVIKGNTLRDLYKRHKESLFSYNIRNYLGSRGINAEIKQTATDDPDDFFYFNNGVSAICTSFDIQGNQIIARDFQVINGAQTIGTLGQCEPNSNIYILFRLTEAKSVKTEKGFNQDVIKYNNSQNVIKVSDFRSNDQIQRWLEVKFVEQKPIPGLPRFRYIRKRSSKRVSGGDQAIKLEELAKIRYAFYWEPTKVIAVPRALWTHEEDGGVYEKAFGINGKLESTWPERDFYDCLLAIRFHMKFASEAKLLVKKNENWRFLNRLKWHSLSLSGIYMRLRYKNYEAKQFVMNEAKFNAIWNDYWQIASVILDEVYTQAMEENVTNFAITRNVERWNRMKSRMEKRIMLLE